VVFLLFVLLQKKLVCKGNTKLCLPKKSGSQPLHTPFQAYSSEFLNNGFTLAFFVTSSYVVSRGYFVHSRPFQGCYRVCLLGVHRPLCLARLLNRSGFRFVTFFDKSSHRFCTAEKAEQSQFHILVLILAVKSVLSFLPIAFGIHSITPLLTNPSSKIKKSAKPLHHLCGVGRSRPVIAGLSTSTFAQLAVGSRAHSVQKFRCSPFLHSIFPTLAQGCFPSLLYHLLKSVFICF
jgi:hypothetical protein